MKINLHPLWLFINLRYLSATNALWGQGLHLYTLFTMLTFSGWQVVGIVVWRSRSDWAHFNKAHNQHVYARAYSWSVASTTWGHQLSSLSFWNVYCYGLGFSPEDVYRLQFVKYMWFSSFITVINAFNNFHFILKMK